MRFKKNNLEHTRREVSTNRCRHDRNQEARGISHVLECSGIRVPEKERNELLLDTCESVDCVEAFPVVEVDSQVGHRSCRLKRPSSSSFFSSVSSRPDALRHCETGETNGRCRCLPSKHLHTDTVFFRCEGSKTPRLPFPSCRDSGFDERTGTSRLFPRVDRRSHGCFHGAHGRDD